jgi:outer membrane protein TolC
MIRQETKRDDASVQLARRERLPDISAGIEARNYTGDGSFRQGTLLLAMNIPWGNGSRYKAEIAREEAKARASRFDADDYERSVREEFHKLLVMIDTARREALLYRDQIIPRSQAGLAALRASWEAGRGNLTDVFEARRMLLEAQTMYGRAVVEQYTAMAQLVLCCGLGDLQALEMIFNNSRKEEKP